MKMTKYPNNLKQIIESRGLTIREVSNRTAISYSTLCKMVEGFANIYVSQYNILSDLAKVLQCDIREFFQEELEKVEQ